MPPDILEIVQAIGAPLTILIIAAVYIWDRGRADSKVEIGLTSIAQKSTEQNANLAQSQSQQITSIYKDMGDLRQSLGHAQGEVSVLKETIKDERVQRDTERRELQDKIDKLEKRIAELEHEKEAQGETIRSQAELIDKLKSERDTLQRQLDERNRLVIDQAGEIDKLDLALRNCRKEKDEVKKKTSELESKITELKQPENIEEEKDSA